MASFIDIAHSIKRRFFRRVDLNRIPIARTLRERLIKKTKASVVDNIHGHRMFLDPGDSLGLSWHKTFEPVETQFFMQNVKPGDVVVDVGANIGYFTLIFAKLVGPQGRVIAFEPEPRNFELLNRNIRENGYMNVETVNKAVGNSDEPLKLFLSEDNMGDHRTYASDDRQAYTNVASVTLDSYFAEFKQPIAFIKMDIQGFEYNTFQGMSEVLKRNPQVTLVTEFWPYGLHRSGASAQQYLRFLKDRGFQLDEISERDAEIRPANLSKLVQRHSIEKPEDFTNLLCRPQKT